MLFEPRVGLEPIIIKKKQRKINTNKVPLNQAFRWFWRISYFPLFSFILSKVAYWLLIDGAYFVSLQIKENKGKINHYGKEKLSR